MPDRDKAVGDLFPPEQLATLPSVDDSPQKLTMLWNDDVERSIELRIPDWFARTGPAVRETPKLQETAAPLRRLED